MSWFRSKKEATPENPRFQSMRNFLSEYNSSSQKGKYAFIIWSNMQRLEDAFGSFEHFQSCGEDERTQFTNVLMFSAIGFLKESDMISAESTKFTVDYLVAIGGMRKAELTGFLEQVSDIVDGILRYGAKNARQLGSMEAKPVPPSIDELEFYIGSGSITGRLNERNSIEVTNIILKDLQKVLITGEDYYWFMIELHDFLIKNTTKIRDMLDDLPLYEIEYKNKKSIDSYVGKSNAGMDYIREIYPSIHQWCAKATTNFNPDEMCVRVIAAAYGQFRMRAEKEIDNMRLEYAVYFRDNCVRSDSLEDAERWSSVISHLS